MFKLLRMDMHRLPKGMAFKMIIILLIADMTLTAVSFWFLLSHAPSGMDLAALGLPSDDLSLPMLVKLTAGALGDVALYLAIYVVLFANGDFSTGFIKTVAGQVKNRRLLAWSKFITIAVYTIGYMLLYMLVITVECRILFGGFGIEDAGRFAAYLFMELYMYLAMTIMITSIVLIIRSTLVGMICGIVIATGLLSTILGLINLLIKKMEIDIDITEYTVTGCIKGANFDQPLSDYTKPVIVCTVYIVLSIIGTLISHTKRDIA